MTSQKVITHFSTPPSLDDLQAIAMDVIEHIPQDLHEYVDNLDLIVQDFPDDGLVEDLELEDEFDLLALYTAGADIKPGIIKKTTGKDDKAFILYRRPILDAWCDTQEDLNTLLRHIIISEIAQSESFPEEQITTMIAS